MQYILVLAVLAVVFLLITGPLRAVRHSRSDTGDDVAGLEAARDNKYQEIRDAELDLRTGKLNDDDYQSIDQTLRAEAIEILDRLDRAQEADARAAAAEEDDLAGDEPEPHDQLPSRS